METWLVFLAIALRPLAYLVLFAVAVAPMIWLPYRIIPDGKLKVFLFRVRSGPEATRRDKVLMTALVIGFYAALFAAVSLST